MTNYGLTLLPHVSFSILFALSLKPQHGYALITQINEDSNGRVVIGPGAVYGALKQLCAETLIEEMPFEGSSRRRYYRLTIKGLNRLKGDIAYHEYILAIAQERHLVN
ncbi:MAG TPA: PadR family transcriptional regulator [Patescibacteria group bacterium]|nr:PadR family transcriptional regulator [Patescibacteria group bacterium]